MEESLRRWQRDIEESIAVKQRVPIAALRELIYPYPTFVRGLEDALRALS